MNAFETGWSVLKSFYFGGVQPSNTESGVWRRRSMLPSDVDPNHPIQPGEFGANLGQRSQTNPGQSAFKDDEGNWMSEDDMVSRLTGTLEHEAIHAAQDPALTQAFGYGGDMALEAQMQMDRGGEAADREEDRMNRFMGAHEYGATQGLSRNRSPDARVNAALDYAAHPALNSNPSADRAASERYRELAMMNAMGPNLVALQQGNRSRQNAQAQLAGAPNVTTPRM